jgi:hypothetical protein
MGYLSTSLTVAYLYRLFFISHNYLTLQRFLFSIIKNIGGKDMWTLELKKKKGDVKWKQFDKLVTFLDCLKE